MKPRKGKKCCIKSCGRKASSRAMFPFCGLRLREIRIIYKRGKK